MRPARYRPHNGAGVGSDFLSGICVLQPRKGKRWLFQLWGHIRKRRDVR